MEWQELFDKFEELRQLFYEEVELMPFSVRKKMIPRKFGIVGSRKEPASPSVVATVRFTGKEVLEPIGPTGRKSLFRKDFNSLMTIGLSPYCIWICEEGVDYSEIWKSLVFGRNLEDRFVCLAHTRTRVAYASDSSLFVGALATLHRPASFGDAGLVQTYTLELDQPERSLHCALERLVGATSIFFSKAQSRASSSERLIWSNFVKGIGLSEIKDICEKSRDSVGASKTLRDIRRIAENSSLGPWQSGESLSDFLKSIPSSAAAALVSQPSR